jgi:type IV pilus assembly protein PilM
MLFLRTLQTVLPPPMFLEMPSIGVDISDTSLKFIECVPTRKKDSPFSVASWGDIDIEEGALHRGVVKQPDRLISALSEVKKRSGVSMIRVSLPEERAYLFETKIKRDTPTKDIRGLLEFRLEENVPLSPRDAHFDYEVISDIDSSHEYRVLVTVYARETIDSYYEACRSAELVPIAFEVEAQAIARATIPKTDKGTHLIVDFGKTRTGVGIVHQGILMYTSTIEIGGGDISKALRKHLGEVPESTLTDIKNTQGLVVNAQAPELTRAMIGTIDDIIEELQTRVDYWNTKHSGDQDRFIESIILCGGSVNMKGIERYFTDKIGISSYRANVWGNVFSHDGEVPPIAQRFAYGYATAIGLAIGAYK